MTATDGILSSADRARLAKRLAELGEVARLMRERPAVPVPPPPVPLHHLARRRHDQTREAS